MKQETEYKTTCLPSETAVHLSATGRGRNADTTRNYYLKDHLGSIRVVLNSANQVISAQDYDAWGYPLENRTYNAGAMRYDFTGKERDKDLENNYNYFGARYYDSRIGRWGGVDTLFMKHYDFSPYNYALVNPLKYIDPNGKQVDVSEQQAKLVFDKELRMWEKIGREVYKEAEKGAAFVVKKSIDLGIKLGARELFMATPDIRLKILILVGYGLYEFLKEPSELNGQTRENDKKENKKEMKEEKNIEEKKEENMNPRMGPVRSENN